MALLVATILTQVQWVAVAHQFVGAASTAIAIHIKETPDEADERFNLVSISK